MRKPNKLNKATYKCVLARSFLERPWFWQMCNSTIKMQICDQPRCFIRSVFSVSMEKVGLVFFLCFFFVFFVVVL